MESEHGGVFVSPGLVQGGEFVSPASTEKAKAVAKTIAQQTRRKLIIFISSRWKIFGTESEAARLCPAIRIVNDFGTTIVAYLRDMQTIHQITPSNTKVSFVEFCVISWIFLISKNATSLRRRIAGLIVKTLTLAA
jgi:hypothetical protein